MWEKWAGSHWWLFFFCVVQSRTHGLCNSSPGLTTQGRLWGPGSAGEWRQMGQGQDFLVRECFPLFLRYTKPIDFFFFPLRWARSWGISRFSVHRMVVTPGPGVRSVRSHSGGSAELWRGRNTTSSSLHPWSVSRSMHIICHLCAIYSSMTLTCASS